MTGTATRRLRQGSIMITLDIETNLSHDTIWVVVTQDVETGNLMTHTAPDTLEPVLRDSKAVIGHNIIGLSLIHI